jgi:Tfp pilus assembly protein PilO
MKWLLPIFLIGVGIGGFVLITKPIYADISDLKIEADAYNQALINSENLQKERDRLTTKFNSITAEDLDRLNKMLPNTVDNIKLILEIQQQAANQGIIVKNVQFEPKQYIDETLDPNATSTQKTTNVARAPAAGKSTDFETFELQFSVEGSYGNFVAFMQLMEQSLRLIDIQSIKFTPGTSEKNKEYTDDYTYLFKINTYRLTD